MTQENCKMSENDVNFFQSQKILEIEGEKSLESTYEHPNSGAALHFLKALVKYGQFSTAFSYGIHKTSTGRRLEYSTRKPRIWGIVSGLLYLILCLDMAVIVLKFDFSVSYSKLVNMIKRVTFGIFILTMITLYYCLQYRGRTMGVWVKILKQADVLQQLFARSGIYFISKKKATLVGATVCIIYTILSVVHVLVFSLGKCYTNAAINMNGTLGWHRFYSTKTLNTFTLGVWTEDYKTEIHPAISVPLGSIGLILEFLVWNLYSFVDAFRLLVALMVAHIFRKLNGALASGKLCAENLPDIMDLHFNATKLLNLFNQLMSPITLTSTAFTILYLCFWTNYLLINFEFKLTYIVGFLTFIRMCVVFYFVADVNTQAYYISTWMENNFTDFDKIPKKVNKTKLTLLTSRIYSREATGFKGMHFFTCTPALNITIGGLVITYTIIVNQVATQ